MVHHSAIRKMTGNDLLRVYEIDQMTDKTPWTQQLFKDCMKIGYECWVLNLNLETIGFGIISYGANEAHLLKLAIDPQHQGAGHGRKMLLHLISQAKSQGCDELFLEVRTSNQPAIALYKNNHFVEIGIRKGYYPADEVKGTEAEDALTMALPLW